MRSLALCRLVCAVCAACLVCALFLTAVELPTFNLNFYSREYDKYNIADNIRVPKDELMAVTARLLDYMRGAAPDLAVTARVDGQIRQFFDQREEEHMRDVRRLILNGFAVRSAAAVVLLLAFVFLCFMRVKGRFRLLAKWVLGAALGFLAVMLALAFLISRDFESAFVIFHHIFFNNNLWILDPSVDLLVNIVPENFFIDLAKAVAALFTAFFAVTVCACAAFLVLTKRAGKNADN